MNSTNGDASKRVLAERKGYLMEIKSSINLMVMSFNMRYNSTRDGINAFENRKPRIEEMLNRYSPDVIGFQEITPVMREWLVETFSQYYMVGAGRNADLSGESCLVAFKKNLFDLVAADTVMLSSTPRVMGSRYEGSDQSECPRVYTRALLKHRDIKDPFWFYNVHTDHKGSLARILASQQLLGDITSHNRNFIMTGDFNALPEADEIKMLTANAVRKIVDVSENVGGTFHAYGKKESPEKIDYIFTDLRNKVVDCSIIEDEPVNDIYLSDHVPLVAVLEMR